MLVTAAALLIAVLGGQQYAWTSAAILRLAAVSLAGLAA